MRKSFILIGLFPCLLMAQYPWSLDQCIQYGVEHNIQIRQAEIKSESSSLEWKQAKYSRLPSLSASVSDGFNFGRTLSNTNVYVNQNSNSANASLGGDLSVFQGMRLSNEVKAKQFDFMASVEDHQKIKNDISLNVTSNFLNVLIQKELVKIAKEQWLLTDTLLKRCEILVDNGKEPVSKAYELKAQLMTDAYNLTNAEKSLQLALLDLAQLLELEDFENFDITMPEAAQSIAEMPIPIVIFERAVVILPNVKAEENRLESAKTNLSIAKAAYSPSLSLSYSTATGYYYLFGDGILPNESFGKQIEKNWRSYVGISMNIPIFNRMQTKGYVAQSKVQIEQQSLAVENARKGIFKEIQRAMLNAKASKERYIASEHSVTANQTSHQYVVQRYESGRATLFDLQQSKHNLERSLSEQIQSKYEFIFNTKILDFYNGNPLK